MAYYIGIDLGTTNSAICSYDGQTVRIWKSPEQNDITPSAIYIDKRGNRYYGQKAYNQALHNPKNSATIFKRFMGTNTRIDFESAGISLTPEECSAEILKVLFGYLPEEIRNDSSTATVITVPAAFNQMKKDATLEAARLAGIGSVALMQEPVAAIMSIMRDSAQEGLFLVYDLGGGTFDVSIAESIDGKVNLLAHGGIEMCGGRDVDREVFDYIVLPWLKDRFELPRDLTTSPRYARMLRIAQWAAERAKIELSSSELSTIALGEEEINCLDEVGNEIFLDIDITRRELDLQMEDIVEETIKATRDTIQKAGLTAKDIERVVFIGGPTNYKPLRDKVSEELGIKTDIDVNPMTAVAEGASIFAESIEWSTEKHNRKKTTETVSTSINLDLRYTARTSKDTASIVCLCPKDLSGHSIQFKCLDTGFVSGMIELRDKVMTHLPLTKQGDNHFSVSVFDETGNKVQTGIDSIVIVRAMATIGSIPASYSIGIEVVDKLGGSPMLEFLVNEGDSLPRKGCIIVKAGQTVKAGSSDSINIKLWEGNIQTNIEDNRFIGVLKIKGTDIEYGTITTGADIECAYEISDSGNINLAVSIPCIGAIFVGQNFYSRQEGQECLSPEEIAGNGRQLLEDIEDISIKVQDPDLEYAKKKASNASIIDAQSNDVELVQKANNDLLEAKKTMDGIRRRNLLKFREARLEKCISLFEESARQFARNEEINTFESLKMTARRSIESNDSKFENVIEEMTAKTYSIMFRQDWFIVGMYQRVVSEPWNFMDKSKFDLLRKRGNEALLRNDIGTLREVFFALMEIQISSGIDGNISDIANIVKR